MIESTKTDAPEELALELRRHGEVVSQTLREMTPGVLAPRSSSSDWSGHDLLAHIASMEWTYPKLIEVAQAVSTPGATERASSGFRDGNDSYNDRQVSRRREQPAGELIAEFERNRAVLVEAVGAVESGLLDVPIGSAGGATGTLAEVLRSVAMAHVDEHLDEIVRAGHLGDR